MFSRQIFIFILFCISCSLCKNRLCDINDNKCMTESSSRRFLDIVSGVPGGESSDPLHLDYFEFNQPKLKFKLWDATLSGMKNCHIELVHFAPKEKMYYAHYGCPHFTLESKYEVKGYVGPEFVTGKGTCQVDYYDYNLLFNGNYEKEILNDGKVHLHLENYNVEIEAKGKVHYDFKNLFNGDKVKSDAAHKFANENWQFVDKLTRQQALESFMTKHVNNVNEFFRNTADEDIFTY